jgi:hypothetical protein
MTPIATAIEATGTEAKVCADIARRQQQGLAKYGVTVADNKLTMRQWQQHLYEELLDAAVYLRRQMDETKPMTRDEVIALAHQQGLDAQPCQAPNFIAIKGEVAHDPNERMRMAAGGQCLIVHDGHYWQVGTVEEVASSLKPQEQGGTA